MHINKWEETIRMLKDFAEELERWPKSYEWDAFAKENKLPHTKTIREKWRKSWEEIGKELNFKVVRKKKQGKKSTGKRIELDIDEIKRFYSEGWYFSEIGEQMNCSAETIRKRLIEVGFEISYRKRRKISQERNDIPNGEVKRLYLEEKWSAARIADEYKTSKTLILRRLNGLGIEPRRYNEYPHVNEDFLREYYEEKRMSSRQVAEIAGCNFRTILKRLKNFEIAVRSEMENFTSEERKEKFGRKKEGHGLWKGGVTPVRNLVRNRLAYLSREVFVRDSFKCKVCGANGGLHAHHIRPFAEVLAEIIEENTWVDFQKESNRLAFVEICEKDPRLLNLDNLVTLCERCHKNEHVENPVAVKHYDILEKEWRDFVEKYHKVMSVSEMGINLGIRPYRIIRYMKSSKLSFAYEHEKWLKENLATKRYSAIAKEFNSKQYPCKSENIKMAAMDLGIENDLSDEILKLYKNKKMLIKSISKKLIVSPGFVKDVLVKKGIHLKEREDVEKAEQEICLLFTNGKMIESITETLDLPRNGVRRILLRNGYNTSSNRMVRHSIE
ncbi:hypothetical protein [Guptibacillus hwajinpoensis]|uniref:hypothetical protein n=1 Tax=Guptibacillus hwajinpoensis TaxID=208199 RepID=UPI0037367C99